MNEEINQENESKAQLRFKRDILKKIIFSLIGIIVVVYIGGFLYFKDTFLNNTTVNQVDVSHMSLQEAHDTLQKNLENHDLTITFIDNQKETLTQKESGMVYNDQNHLDDLYQSQNRWLWFVHIFKSENLTLEDVFNVDNDQLLSSLQNLQHMAKDQQVAPIDAKVEFKDNAFTIIPESNGSTILTETFKDLVISSFLNNQKELDLYKSNGYNLPKIKSDDKNLKDLLNLANQYCNAKITYETVNGDVVLDENKLLTWLSKDKNNVYSYDEKFYQEKAAAFVKDLASKINSIGKTRTFTLANGRRVTVSGGNYGLKLNQSKEVTALIKDIQAKKKEKRTPVTTGVQASYSNNGLGNTFVEVDLSNQKVYYVKNGQTVLSTNCVTGKHTDPDRRTPAGTYYLYMKQRNRVLRGTRNPDGTWPYESPVSYWMPFNRGIGLHDADWRNKFGGDIYINSGSHGCINLPVGVAGQLYNSITVKTPVVVHY